MPQQSSGLLMYRRLGDNLEFFLVHPGGPFYKNKNEGVWSIPKGMIEDGEEFLAGAKREFEEETGLRSSGPYTELGTCKLKSGKIVHAWAFEGKWDGTPIRSNTFPLEWPPHSGKTIQVPEADRAHWFTPEAAMKAIHPHQVVFLERAMDLLAKHH